MPLRVVVGGFLGLLPAGGVTWDYIQYPLGLAELGHDVFYIEDTRLWPVYQQGDGGEAGFNVVALADAMGAFGLGDRWAYRDESCARWFGLGERRVHDILRTADVLINVSCATAMTDAYARIPRRILVDSDPMFTQIQAATGNAFTIGGGGMKALLAAHTHHFTFGENIGAPDCRIPDTGIAWRITRQPICLDHWPVFPTTPGAAFSTVMNWNAGRALDWGGDTWGQKNLEFVRFLDLPRRASGANFTLAVGQTSGDPFPEDLAAAHGWHVVAAEAVVPTWRDYRRFIQDSRGEWSIAKEGYVKARTGWFSCRSACYLASGRPVVTQDTAWSRHLPIGAGLFAFDTIEEAASAVRAIAAEPARHARAARQVAEEHFDSRRVLGRMLEQVGA